MLAAGHERRRRLFVPKRRDAVSAPSTGFPKPNTICSRPADMHRRTVFKWLFSTAIPFVLPNWARAQRGPLTGKDALALREIAETVLPASLGAHGIDAVVADFTQWLRSYKAGAEMSSGYGLTTTRVVPPDPSIHYSEQLERLEAEAHDKRGVRFAKLDQTGRRDIIRAALDAANVSDIPRRPNGQHVVADLMGFFFFVNSNGHDFLYNAAIKRDTCRGLASSGQRPRPVR
jgi:hypothetical protein